MIESRKGRITGDISRITRKRAPEISCIDNQKCSTEGIIEFASPMDKANYVAGILSKICTQSVVMKEKSGDTEGKDTVDLDALKEKRAGKE